MGNMKLKVVLTAIMLVFAVLPALIIGAVGMITIASYESGVKQDTLAAVAESKSAAIDQLFTAYTSTVGAVAKNKGAADAVNGKNTLDSALQAVVANDPDILDMMILDANCKVIKAVNASQNTDMEHKPDGQLASVSGILSWQNYGGVDGIYISKSITDPSGLAAGYAVAVVSVGQDSAVMKALGGKFLDNSEGHMALVSDAGESINFTGNSGLNQGFDGAVKDAVLKDFNSSALKDGCVKNSAGGYAYVLGSISGVNTWKWVGVVSSGIFVSFSAMTNVIGWAVVLIAAAAASLIAMVIVRRFIGNMNEMLGTMGKISGSDEDKNVRFTIKNRKSELGEIQSSFNELLDEVFLSEERHRTIAELSDNMLFEWDFTKERMYVSPNTLTKFEIDTSASTLSNGRFIDSLMTPEDAEKYKRDINMLLKNKSGYSGEYQLRTKSNAVIWVSLRASCITDRLGEPLRVLGVMTDIDNEKKLELKLSERASYDFLSQLYNRNTFIRNLTNEIEHRGSRKIAVLFIDVDDFKFINDRFGHTIGDEVIRYVADTIRTKVDDKGGFAGRFGGDEFVLCFTDQDDIENIENISMDIINELYTGYTSSDGGTSIDVKASVGVALCPEHSEDVNELLSFADTAMYFVKKNGKTNYHIYLPEDSESGEYIDPEGF